MSSISATQITGPQSPLLRTLHRALQLEAQEQNAFVIKVGVLAAMDYSRSEIADRLSASPSQVRSAFDRLKRASEHIDVGIEGL